MSIIAIIAPLIFIVFIGFCTAKKQWLNQVQFDGISKLTFYGFIPVYLFYHMSQADLSSQLSIKLFAAFYLPVLLCYGLGFVINYFFHRDKTSRIATSAVFGLNVSYSNNIIVGLPVLLLAIGEQSLAIIFIIVTFHSAMLFGLTGAFSVSGNGFKWKEFIIQNLKNPLILGILSGLVFNLLGFEVPAALKNSLQLFGKPAVTLALFVLGASLATYQVTENKRFIFVASLIKLLILPALVYCFSHILLSLPALTTQVLVILSSCPIGVNAYLIAKNYQHHQELVASSVIVSTVSSGVTIPLWLMFLNL
ncbi:AEC family transporter [Thalassotalea atypica]|uniref:AEC family transporter n=1 Tax=Thalassotalea atypica TaxID=2054316 RepID=UPI0025730C78|nr:AEC family transporter [Thalassotalea atypica]